ncbi:DNA integrity scanning protein DisA nucleotide-binding domain protein [Hyunsoonleella sp. SJ7]|uniref:Diadenylate cyclase n=1 Tax=Hyunsoonleella aquatilis TaxID=2762758 RepID=A0A923KGX6_9FLAO|nr:diadenylate cyclase [Hyunsoonleella aquatilis]MBC3759261.1 DNA integrity scanning protein DisA nucleotide-binding domain protein [Hyunsoonleella aquatilis]
MDIFDDILNLRFIDYLDVVLVALLLYYLYKLVKGTVAINIFLGIIIIYGAWRLTEFLNMELLSGIFGGFMKVGIIALIVVFQPEIRKFLLMVGSTNFGRRRKFLQQLKFLKTEGTDDTNVDAIISACSKMSMSKTGALIVFERNNNLDFLSSSGDEMNIKVTQPIIESIFFKNSPLHDGAIIISNNIVKATRVVLPVNNEKHIPQRFGLRHRAAIGITEKTDALALAVSEETGHISYFKDGEFVVFEDTTELAKMIKNDLA